MHRTVSLPFDPPEQLRVGRAERRSHVIADDQNFHFRLASQQSFDRLRTLLVADGMRRILVQ
jgi:hypothetical protein